MDTPLISIIIPTYNSGQVIDSALASVASQSLSNYEVIVVDGLSTDETLQIAQKYLDQGLKIIVVSEKDSGIYDAMNKGLKIATGRWIYFLGSDDTLFSQQTLERVMSLPETAEYDVL